MGWGRGKNRAWLGAAGFAATIVATAIAGAAPTLRYQVDQKGDFVLLGNTLGQDCASGAPAPVVGSVGACGTNLPDSSPDVFWFADAPAAGQAAASTAVSVAQARSTAVLALPAGATVNYARLYWGAMRAGTTADTQVTLSRPGVFGQIIDADVSHTLSVGADVQYESSALVTSIVQQHGIGAYRVGGVDSISLTDITEPSAYAAWSLVVLYELDTQPLRQLTIFDGLDSANSGSGVVVNLSGFLVPQTGIDAKLGIVAYGGNGQTGGDTLTFNGFELSDGSGGQGFFNASRTYLGALVSNSGDLPQLTGGSRSMSNVDLDVVNVTAQVTPLSTSATVVAKAGGDLNILLGAAVTSITTFKPNFNDSLKTAVDINGGALLAGDVLEYTVNVVNTGNDPALGVVLEDVLPSGVTYVPGSIKITTGPNAGAKTDAAGDDQGEFDTALGTVRVRLGTGANATTGGSMAIGESSTVVFRVTVNAGAVGTTLSNQATIKASGVNGAPVTTFKSDDGNGGPTTSVVDACETNAQCSAPKPVCYDPPQASLPNICVECNTDTDCSGTSPICDAGTKTCRACTGDGECKDPLNPACHANGPLAGACTACSANNASTCGMPDPICLTSLGICGCTDTDGDSECGGPTSGVICNAPAGSCVPGCSKAANRNDCPTTQFCSDTTGAVGTCSAQPCLSDADCSAPKTHCDMSVNPHVCVQCLSNTDCTAPDICDVTGTKTCVECTPTSNTCDPTGPGGKCLSTGNCGCAADSDCGNVTSGRVCNASVALCANGCRGAGFGNGCPTGLVCTSTDATIGTCIVPDECQTNADCQAPNPICDTASSPKKCVGCVNPGDCTSQNPVCQNNTCTGCTSDADCKDPTLPACHTEAGDLKGQCKECSATNATLCGVNANVDEPICLSNLGVCGCTDVDGDSECGGPTSGRICDGPVGKCIAGCSKEAGRNDCPTTEWCDVPQGQTVGTCKTHCNTNADCATAPELVCDLANVPHVCRECTASDQSQCSAAATGAACLSDYTCGCETDADCGDTQSGRVCPDTNKCTSGCRGTGGNGCPSGKVCTSKDETIGQCVDEQPDAGTGGTGGAGGTGGTAATGGSAAADAGPDAGSGKAGSVEGGGCACSVPSRDRSSPGWLLLALGAAAAALSRSRRRRASRASR